MSFGYHIQWKYIRQIWNIGFMAKPSPSSAGNKSLVKLGNTIRHLRTIKNITQENQIYKKGVEKTDKLLRLLDGKPSTFSNVNSDFNFKDSSIVNSGIAFLNSSKHSSLVGWK